MYFWPFRRSDGSAHADLYSTKGRIKYYADLREMALTYSAACDEVMNDDPAVGSVLDNPNAHRAVELAVHTIPTFGHARNCSELVLESIHHVFKKWLEKNPHQDSHITAFELARRYEAKDWVYFLSNAELRQLI